VVVRRAAAHVLGRWGGFKRSFVRESGILLEPSPEVRVHFSVYRPQAALVQSRAW